MPRIEEYDNKGNLINTRYEGTPQEQAEDYKRILLKMVDQKLQERIPYTRLVRLAAGDLSNAEKTRILNFITNLKAKYAEKRAILDAVDSWDDFDTIDFTTELDAIREE